MAPRKEKTEATTSPPTHTGSVASSSSFNQQLTSYIRSGKAGVFIVSHEEVRVEAEMASILKHLDDIGKGGFQFYTWSCTQGVQNVRTNEKIADTQEPLGDTGMLQTFMKLPEQSILLARDFHSFLGMDNPVMTRTIRDALVVGKKSSRIFITVGCTPKIPEELSKEMAIIEFKLPTKEQLALVLDGVAKSGGVDVGDNGKRDAILDAASGCTTQEAEDAFAISWVECGDIRPDIVAREKSQIIRRNGILEIVETELTLDDIGGLDLYKEHLWSLRNCFSKAAREYGLPSPRPVICCGQPGTAKSMSAMACKNVFKLPLLRLEAGRLFGSLVGQSELNWRTAFSTAKAVAPAIVWIDEAEALFSGGESSGRTDGGTTNRIIKNILQDMQFNSDGLFFVFTSNDIDQFPDPLIDRCDVWSFELPTLKEREAIWKIHIAKRKRKPDAFDIRRLAEKTDGYSGRQIEQVWLKSLTAAFNDQVREPTNEDVEAALAFFVPTSVTMRDAIERRRARLKNRARAASSQETATLDGPRKMV